MPKRVTKQEFIERSIQMHGNKYDYSQIIWVNTKTKVFILCFEHGIFEQVPEKHLIGQGCPKCSLINRGNKRRSTTEDWVKKVSLKFNNKFDYSKTNYTGIDNKVIIICPIHGDFEQIAYEHQSSIHGCPKCAWDSLAENRKDTWEEIVIKANKIHKNLYSYPDQVYKNQNTLIEIICSSHGKFYQTPGNHLSGKGCPICRHSKGELLIQNWLMDNKIFFKPQFELIINEIARNTKLVIIDFFVEYNNKKYFIEYDGIQHFQYVPCFHHGGIVDFEKQQNRDRVLNEYCEVLEHAVTLIRFDYTQSNEEIIKILSKNFC